MRFVKVFEPFILRDQFHSSFRNVRNAAIESGIRRAEFYEWEFKRVHVTRKPYISPEGIAYYHCVVYGYKTKRS